MRRVDGLEADVELAARSAAEADRRAGTPAPLKAQAEVSPFADTTLKAQAERFFAALGAFMEGVQRNGAAAGAAGGLKSVPERLVVALDHVDALPQGKARALLEAAHRAFASPGIVTLVVADPARIEADAAALEKWIQVPFRLEGAGAADHAAFVAHIIGQADAEGTPTRTEVWAPLDWSISAAESGLLAAVAPLAGGSPRAVKRLVNLYRIARPQAREDKSVLAMMLALEQGGTSHEIATVKDAVGDRDSDADFEIEPATPRLFAVFQMLRAVEGRVSVESARRAVAVAKTFSLRV
jgi:hypothetical protein